MEIKKKLGLLLSWTNRQCRFLALVVVLGWIKRKKKKKSKKKRKKS